MKKTTKRDYSVWHKGKCAYSLNEQLASKQNITDHQLEVLKDLHQVKLKVFDVMFGIYTQHREVQELISQFPSSCLAMSRSHAASAAYDVLYTTKKWLRQYDELVGAIESEMQQNWNFPVDLGMHEWYKVPGCSCPYMDNEERRFPSIHPDGHVSPINRIINQNCIIHGTDYTRGVSANNYLDTPPL